MCAICDVCGAMLDGASANVLYDPTSYAPKRHVTYVACKATCTRGMDRIAGFRLDWMSLCVGVVTLTAITKTDHKKTLRSPWFYG